jgi:NADH-quinone oxidoreductase subunit J
MIETVFFYLFSAILILSALLVITAKNPVHSVLFLILAFFNAAGLFVMLGAEFLAMTLVIVYVGAVAVLFLFVVMMLDIDFVELRKVTKKYAAIGGFIGAVLLAEMLFMFHAWEGDVSALARAVQPVPDPKVISNTHALGHVLYTHYVYLFQVSGLILLVAMIGAITLTLRQRPETRRQNVADQIARDPKDVLKVEKITSGAGVS